MTTAIEVAGLTKQYRGTPVLRGVDLTAEQGEIVALLGSNGAGKTTAISILTTLTRADSGTAVVAGCDVRRDPGACGSGSRSPASPPLSTTRSPAWRTW